MQSVELTRRRLFFNTPLAAFLIDQRLKSASRPRPLPNLASPSEFGAEGNDGQDHTDAFKKALLKAAGGAVIVPPGTFNIRGNILRIPPGTSVLGYGRSSILRRINDGTLVDLSGTSTKNRNGGCLIRDVVLDGGDHRGYLVRAHYTHDLVFDNVWSCRNRGIALEAVELWDSRFTNCTWDWCSGSDNASPAVLLSNQESEKIPTGDNTNAVYFINCRWESFQDGALWLADVGHQSMSQVHLINCKMETSYARGCFLRISRAVRNVTVQNLYLCGNGFDRNCADPIDLIDFKPYALARLENVAVWLNAPIARTIIRAEVGHPSCIINNVWVDGTHNPNVALLENLGLIRASVTNVGYIKPMAGLSQV